MNIIKQILDGQRVLERMASRNVFEEQLRMQIQSKVHKQLDFKLIIYIERSEGSSKGDWI